MKQMDRTSARRSAPLTILISIAAVAATLALPQSAAAVTLVAPAAAEHLDWVMLRPTVAFDVAQGEQPKWVLIASDAEMKSTIRYCRQFTGVRVGQGHHWGCNTWATGVDAWGRDIVRNLEWGKTYHWQLVFTAADGSEQKSEIRSFAIDNEPETGEVSEVSDRIFGTVFGDGTELNLGAAAFVNSGLKIDKASSTRRSKNRFWLRFTYSGGVDLTRSYVRIKSKAGTRYVRVTATGERTGRANWVRSASERRLRPGRYEWQVFLKSSKNGAMVRSSSRIIVVKTRSRKKKRRSVPAWRRT